MCNIKHETNFNKWLQLSFICLSILRYSWDIFKVSHGYIQLHIVFWKMRQNFNQVTEVTYTLCSWQMSKLNCLKNVNVVYLHVPAHSSPMNVCAVYLWTFVLFTSERLCCLPLNVCARVYMTGGWSWRTALWRTSSLQRAQSAMCCSWTRTLRSSVACSTQEYATVSSYQTTQGNPLSCSQLTLTIHLCSHVSAVYIWSPKSLFPRDGTVSVWSSHDP